MKIIIGGSPGTGSSLLRQVLNRHPDIYCGPELQLFIHPQLFDEWEKVKRHLVVYPLLKAPSLHPLKGSRLAGREQQWTEMEVLSLIDHSPSFEVFARNYFLKPMALYGKAVWAEKTPENVLTFKKALDLWDDCWVVNITRDPADTIASLHEREFSVFYAAARYLFNVGHALTCEGHPRFLTMRYEDLASDPGTALDAFLKKLNLSTGPEVVAAMTSGGNPAMHEPDRLTGWRSSELSQPSTRSIGRFNDMPPEMQQRIAHAMNCISISSGYAANHDIEKESFREIINSLGYSLPEIKIPDPAKALKKLRREMRNYRWRQIGQRRLFFEKNTPIEIRI